MMNIMFPIFLLLNCVWQSFCLMLQATGTEYDTNSLFDITAWKILEVERVSMTYCLYYCMLVGHCLGFVFDKTVGKCQLISVSPWFLPNITVPTHTLKPDDTVYYKIQRFQTEPSACPEEDGYMLLENDTLCFKYHSEHLTYISARETCLSEGGELLKIDSQTKQLYVKRFFAQLPQINDYVIIQGIKISSKWLYNDGSVMTYFSWYANEGNNNEEYIAILPSNDCFWYDIPSWFQKPFLCEIQL